MTDETDKTTSKATDVLATIFVIVFTLLAIYGAAVLMQAMFGVVCR